MAEPEPISPDKAAAAEAAFKESVKHVTASEVDEAAKTGEAKFNRLAAHVPKAMAALWGNLGSMIGLVKDYTTGKYREVPFKSIASIAAAILYFVSPIDVIPDFIFGIGYIDDAAVVALCLSMVASDLDAYRRWRDGKTSAAAQLPMTPPAATETTGGAS